MDLLVMPAFIDELGKLAFKLLKKASHTATLPGGSKIDIEKLYGVVEGRTPTKVPLDFKFPTSKDRGFGEARLRAADTSYPIMYTADGHLVDGRHRVTKLRAAGATEGYGHLLSKDDIDKVRIKKASATKPMDQRLGDGPEPDHTGRVGRVARNSTGGPAAPPMPEQAERFYLSSPQLLAPAAGITDSRIP